jgi:hypothetical protein
MTLIVEDGTVIANSNTYVTVDEFITYAENCGAIAAAEADEEQIEPALINAAKYLEQKYRLLWMGSRVDAVQSMDWPRRGVPVIDFFDPFYDNARTPIGFQDTYFIPENEIPAEVKEAQNLLALATFGGGSTSSNALQPSYGRKTKREKAGVLEVEYMTAEEGGNTSMTNTYWDAGKTIEPFLRPEEPHTGNVVRS